MPIEIIGKYPKTAVAAQGLTAIWYKGGNLTLVDEIIKELVISCSFWLFVILFLTFLI